MTGWQPIESAPRDGVRILCVNANGRIEIGTRKLFFDISGLYEIFRNEEFCPGHTWDIKPTHWMPLPEPPEAQS